MTIKRGVRKAPATNNPYMAELEALSFDNPQAALRSMGPLFVRSMETQERLAAAQERIATALEQLATVATRR
jgi:hypothetical protein